MIIKTYIKYIIIEYLETILKISLIFYALIFTLNIFEENFYIKCTRNYYIDRVDDVHREVVQELLKRIYLPTYLPLISLIACFIIIKSKESQSYAKLKFLLFSIGIIILLFSKLSIKFASTNQVTLLTFLLIPCLIFYLTFNIFKTRARKI